MASCAGVLVASCTSDRDPGGVVMVGESSQDTHGAHDHGTTARVAQDLSANNFQGTSLPAKTLALTFDDGPGPRTKELSMYLKSQNIKAAFFMNGARLAATGLSNPNGIMPVADPAGTLAQVLADGHLVANHTTTHRQLTAGDPNSVPNAQRVQELSDTDTDITGYVSPQNHFLFRPPYGAYDGTVFATLSASAMNKYVGPINWEAGGYDAGFPARAADWACWQGLMRDAGGTLINVGNDAGFATTKQCGDAYIAEIESTFPKGIVLMHDPYSWSKNGASGSTVDMVKYILPILVGKGYSFVRVDQVPAIAAALPADPCNATCATCSGPSANECIKCLGGRYKSGGQCLTCTTCTASEYVSAACTTTANITCGACDASCVTCSGPAASQCTSCAGGKYLSGGGCQACNVCGAGTFQATACTTSANATCTACPAGSFSKLAGSTMCTACGSCDDANACTQDRCDPATGCVHDPIVGCGATPSTDAGIADTDAGADAGAEGPATAGGCSVSAQPGRQGRGGRGLAVLAALGMSLLARRRRPHARAPRVG